MRDLISELTEIKRELSILQKKRRSLVAQLNRKGYSLKKIGGQYYLYVWIAQGKGRAKWMCLGNVSKEAKELLKQIKEEKREKEKIIREELKKLEEKEKEIRQMLSSSSQSSSKTEENSHVDTCPTFQV